MVFTVKCFTTYLTFTVKVFVLSSITSASDSFHNSLYYSQSALVKLPSNYYYTSSFAGTSKNNSNTFIPAVIAEKNVSETSTVAAPATAAPLTSQVNYQSNRIYQQGSTLAMVSFITSTRELTYCVIYDIDKDRDKVVILFKLYFNSIFHINIDDMIRLIDTCRDVDMKRNPSLYHPPAISVSTATGRSFGVTSASRSDSGTLSGIVMNNFTEIWTGMVPGTKWCGLGDSASHYFDLGSKGIVDSCCRAHDLCPIRLRPFRKDYGLGYNFSIYTKSYCTCDDSFYHCLKSTNSAMADMIGNFYFNFMKFGCLEPVLVDTGDKNNNKLNGITRNGKNSGGNSPRNSLWTTTQSTNNNNDNSSGSSGISSKKSKSISKEVKLRVNYTRNLRY